MITIYLPIPPSVNKSWAPVRTKTGARMVKRAASREWANAARWEVVAQRDGQQISVPFEATIVLPKLRGDIDNRVKQLLDACQHGGAVTNDSLCRRLVVETDPERHGNAEIFLRPIE